MTEKVHPDLDGEEWRSVPGFDGRYEVSTLGRVRSNMTQGNKPWPLSRAPSPHVLAAETIRGGYVVVGLHRNGRNHVMRVHRIVMLAFVGPRPPDAEVRHLDGDPANNALSNLRYGTSRENARDRVGHGTAPCGEGNGFSRLTEKMVRDIRAASDAGESCASIARRFGIGKSTAHEIATRKRWRHVA